MPPARRSCLVAVDGSRPGVATLVWALRHAADQDMDVEVLTVWPDHRSPWVHEVPGHFCDVRWSALAAQERVVREARTDVGPLTSVTTRLENADAAEAIVRVSSSHDLVVLGSDGAGGPHRLTDEVVRDAACEVVVLLVADTGATATTRTA